MGKSKLCKCFFTLATAIVLVGTFANETLYAADFKQEYRNPKPAKKGGTLHVGYVSKDAFKGIFAPELADDGPTGEVSQFGGLGLFKVNKNYEFVKGGMADIEFDRKEKLARVKIAERARWSDGKPVVTRDLIYAYEIIGNQESHSSQYSDELANIVGMKEYHTGEAKTISGLEAKDDKNLVIHFQKMTPTMNNSGSGYVWQYAEPYHYLKDVAFKDLASSDKIRKDPLFYGPFKLSKVVAGEALEWVPNRYYYKKPKLAKIELETVAPAQAAAAIKADKYDLVLNQGTETYLKVKNDKKFVQLGEELHYYSYMGFRVGKRTKDGGSVMDKNAPANDKALRQAMAHAMNIEQVNKKFSHGLSQRANTVVPTIFGKWNDKKIKGYEYNLKKANAILDKAGYKRQKDGYRVRPNGKQLTLVALASESGTEIANYIQQWKKIGVRVKLYNGRLQEFNSMVEKMMNGATDVDIWFAAWGTSSEPTSIASLYRPTSPYNVGHFVTKENTELIDSLNSEKAFNEKYQLKQFYKWQAYMHEQAFVVPRTFNYQTYTVGKNVKGITLENGKEYSLWEHVALTN